MCAIEVTILCHFRNSYACELQVALDGIGALMPYSDGRQGAFCARALHLALYTCCFLLCALRLAPRAAFAYYTWCNLHVERHARWSIRLPSCNDALAHSPSRSHLRSCGLRFVHCALHFDSRLTSFGGTLLAGALRWFVLCALQCRYCKLPVAYSRVTRYALILALVALQFALHALEICALCVMLCILHLASCALCLALCFAGGVLHFSRCASRFARCTLRVAICALCFERCDLSIEL